MSLVMRKTATFPLIALGMFLMAWMNIPRSRVERLRSHTVGFVAPALSNKGVSQDTNAWEVEQLQLQNKQLMAKLETACEWLAWERKQHLEEGVVDRKLPFIKALMALECAAIPASVIYRDPTSWSSSLWIRVGEAENRLLGEQIVAKNSPVISGSHLLGVIDYVGKHQSRVRLITDSGVVPAVRVLRGGEVCLAKGEVHGSSSSLWRSRNPTLKGIGFNYEYADERGFARDLQGETSLIAEGDLLITSGLDGVFPEGLVVGQVIAVEPLKEGAYAYELTARPALGHINEVKTVFVLPPVSPE
jgi:rod shape-determining protein MreC